MFNLFSHFNNRPPMIARALSAGSILLAAAAHADPGYYLVTVYEDEGVANVDFRYWTVKSRGSPTIVWPEVGVGYGVTKRWYTELFASNIGTSVRSSRLSSWNWQNDYLLTQGQYDVDVALHTNLVHNSGGPNVLEFGPVAQTEVGRFQLNGNLVFERAFSVPTPNPTLLKYQWQVKYRWRPEFQFGLQGFGEVGPWDHWSPHSRQSHRVGPVVSGSIPVGATNSLRYQAAFLSGSIYSLPGHMLSVRIQYVF